MKKWCAWRVPVVFGLLCFDWTCPVKAQESPGLPDSLVIPSSAPEVRDKKAWGLLGLNLYPFGDHVASNGVEFSQLFGLSLNFNLWLWHDERLYLFSDGSFWGQKPAPGITNANQGAFDFSKREFDLSGGVAWNYHTSWEARAFAYSFNNLNRGNSPVRPSGFNDGIGLENRYYLGDSYAYLGTDLFDQPRVSFLSVGYFPTKSMVDGNGDQFRPGPFARAYLTFDLWKERCYIYGDAELICTQSFQPRLLNLDAGVALRPFETILGLEFRLGTQTMFNLGGSDVETSVYVGVLYAY